MYLNDTRIPVRDEARFLGLIFDRKLTFLPHIRDLKQRCLRALNAFKVLSNKEWGGTSDVLLSLYRSLVRSKLDYGCLVYGSARKSYLEMLDPVHNQGLRLALGAYRSSPVESLLAEANEPCLPLRRRQLGIQYAMKIKSVPSNPAFNCIYNIDHITLLTFNKSDAQKPFSLRVREDMESFEILEDEVIEFSFPDTPPWILQEPKIDLSLTKHAKLHTPPRTYQKFFKEITQKHPNRTHIFTDGSKDLASVGAAAYSSAAASQRKINGSASIFTAEAIARGFFYFHKP